jgi:hypothetical protein
MTNLSCSTKCEVVCGTVAAWKLLLLLYLDCLFDFMCGFHPRVVLRCRRGGYIALGAAAFLRNYSHLTF